MAGVRWSEVGGGGAEEEITLGRKCREGDLASGLWAFTLSLLLFWLQWGIVEGFEQRRNVTRYSL